MLASHARSLKLRFTSIYISSGTLYESLSLNPFCVSLGTITANGKIVNRTILYYFSHKSSFANASLFVVQACHATQSCPCLMLHHSLDFIRSFQDGGVLVSKGVISKPSPKNQDSPKPNDYYFRNPEHMDFHLR